MSWVQKNWTEAEPYSFTCHFVLLRWSLENTCIHIAVGVMLCQALMKKERAVDIWSRWWMFEVCVFMKWEGVMSRAIALKMLSMNIEVHVSFSIMVSSGYIPNNGINGSFGSFIPFFFFFLRNLHLAIVQSLSSVWVFATPWTAAYQISLSFTISRVCSNLCPLSQWCYPNISSFPYSSPYWLYQFIPTYSARWFPFLHTLVSIYCL